MIYDACQSEALRYNSDKQTHINTMMMEKAGVSRNNYGDIFEENESSGELLRLIYESDPGGISVVSGKDLIFELANPAYRRLTPHPEIDPIGKPYTSIWSPAEGFFSHMLISKVLETGEEVHLDHYERDFPDGSKHYFVYHLYRINYHFRPAVLSILWEITDRVISNQKAEKSARLAQENANRLAQTNQELEQLLFIVSHDLQEPLRKVQAFADRLGNRYRSLLPKEGQEDLDRVQTAGNRSQKMLQDLLEYARVTTGGGKFESTRLDLVVKQILVDLEAVIQSKQAVIDVMDLPTITAKAHQMFLLFSYLIENALRYTRNGVQPVIKIWAEDGYANSIKVYIQDNGAGFEERFSNLIFLPFQRLDREHNPQGTGMGLAISKRIVEHHHGQIQVSSRAGEGSTFTVILPKQQDIQPKEEGNHG